MKKITLRRPKENFNKNCSCQIVVGEKILTELKTGEEKTIEIPDEYEKEQLKAKIYWCGSEKIELQNISENKKVIVRGNKFLNRKLPLIGAMLPLTGLMILTNNDLISKNIGVGILVLILIGSVGTLTIGKNKWLQLTTEE